MFLKYKKFMQNKISLSIDGWKLFESKLKIVKFKKGDIIHNIGDICHQLLFINKGIARAYSLDEKGKDYTNIIYFNDINSNMINLYVVDYESFVNQNESRLEIQALEDCEFISINYKDIQFIYNNLKNGERFGRLMNQEAYSYSHHKIIDLQSKSAKERFDDFMYNTPFLLEKVPQYHIATLLGISPEHLSRLKKNTLLINIYQ